MTLSYLNTLLDFHYWARDRMLAAVTPLTPEQYDRTLGNSFSSVRDTVNHIFGAEPSWYRTDARLQTVAGVAASSPFWEMFVHVVNHATYHRGQVTTLLRQLGAQPPETTDMIAFFRARRAESGR